MQRYHYSFAQAKNLYSFMTGLQLILVPVVAVVVFRVGKRSFFNILNCTLQVAAYYIMQSLHPTPSI